MQQKRDGPLLFLRQQVINTVDACIVVFYPWFPLL